MLITSTDSQIDKVYNQAQEFLKKQKYNQTISTINKAHKRLNLTTAQHAAFVILEITALVNTGKTFKAETLLQAHWQKFSKQQQIDSANIVGAVFATSEAHSNPEKALHYLRRSYALDQSINNANAIAMLIQLYMLLYDFTESEKLWIKVSKWQDYFDSVSLQRLMTSYLLNFKTLALDSIQFMLRNKTQISKRNYELLIHYLMYLNLNDDVELLLKADLDRFSSNDSKTCLTALAEFEDNKIEQCINTLDNIKKHFSFSYNLLGKSEEKLENFTQAFSYFERSALMAYEENKGKSFPDYLKDYNKVDLSKLLSRLEHQEKHLERNKALIEIDGKPVELCFMVGFPRSGTTLLDSILDSQSSITVLSEIGTLDRLIAKYNRITGKKYPVGLESLSLDNIQSLRKEYTFLLNNYFRSRFQLEDQNCDNKESIELIIDKMPLSSIHLPFIRCLFPEVKIICSIRHPLDVILSNFQQTYEMNTEMSYLISLEDCVTRYISVFDHIDKCEKSLDLNFYVVRYEDLVSDFEEQAISTFNYLNIIPNENYKEFYKHASNKIVATSSRSQVVNKIYNTSAYKWTNYRKQMEPYVGRLMPYIKKFGYESTM